MHPEPQVRLHASAFADLDATTLYALLTLRVDVFVVEQECAYRELDGRDVEPGTRHLWLARDDQVLAYLRILKENERTERIGRVAVAPSARGAGLASRLLEEEALTVIGARDAVLEAQAHLAEFYGRHGFVVTGPQYIEDGIAHLPMRRQVTATS